MYDVVIIGAGIGGLICGCGLAKYGYQVVMLEQHSMVGGCCTSFRRGGFHFDAGAHLLSGCGSGGALYRILKNLEAKTDLIKVNDYERININNICYEYPTTLMGLKKYLCELQPHESENIYRFFKDIRSKKIKDRLKDISYTVFLDRYFDSKIIKTILSAMWLYLGNEPSRLCALDAVDVFYSYWNEGTYYPQGGAQTFVENIAQKFVETGGRILLSKKAIRIEKIKQGYEIIDHTGQVYQAEFVVNNSDFKSFFKSCGANVKLNAIAADLFNHGKESIAFFCSYWGIHCDDSYVQSKSGWYIDEKQGTTFLITIPSLTDRSICPDKCHIIDVFTPCDGRDKKVQLERQKMLIESIFINIESKVIQVETANYKTFERYTSNYHGCAYGWDHSVTKEGNRRLPYLIGNNIYQVGHWAESGSGVMAAAISGQLVAQKISGREGLF